MGLDLLLDLVGIFGVVTDNVLQIKEVLGINTGKLETGQTVIGSEYLAVHLDSRPHARQENGENAVCTLWQQLVYLEQAATDAEISNTLDQKLLIPHAEPCPNIKANPTKPPFFRRHINTPIKIVIAVAINQTPVNPVPSPAATAVVTILVFNYSAKSDGKSRPGDAIAYGQSALSLCRLRRHQV